MKKTVDMLRRLSLVAAVILTISIMAGATYGLQGRREVINEYAGRYAPNPHGPDKPDKPDEPDNPDRPDRPDRPERPVDPGRPGRPGRPDQPRVPYTPAVPNRPNTAVPGTPTPNVPGYAYVPNVPEILEMPEDPGMVVIPATPKVPNVQYVPNVLYLQDPDDDASGDAETTDKPGGSGGNPKTGDETDARIWLILLAVSACMARYILYKKEEKAKSNAAIPETGIHELPVTQKTKIKKEIYK